jgi:transcriptional regulator with XRE-family HTH domain
MENTVESLGERLARLRKAKGLTQDQLAKLAGVGQSTVGGIEKNARAKIPGSLIDIAHALGVDAYYLRYGVSALVANDMMIDKVVSLMRETAKEGKAIVLDKAGDVQAQYPLATGKRQKS